MPATLSFHRVPRLRLQSSRRSIINLPLSAASDASTSIGMRSTLFRSASPFSFRYRSVEREREREGDGFTRSLPPSRGPPLGFSFYFHLVTENAAWMQRDSSRPDANWILNALDRFQRLFAHSFNKVTVTPGTFQMEVYTEVFRHIWRNRG